MSKDNDKLAHLLARGLGLQERGDFAAATSVFEELVTDAPHWPEALSRLAYAHERLGHIAEAKAWYRKALDEDERIAWVWARLGTIAADEEDAVTANEYLRQALSLDDSLTEAQWGMARVRAQEDDLSRALIHAQRAVELAPETPRYTAYLAYVNELMGRFDEAERWYEKTIQLNEGWWSARVRLGWLCLDQGRWQEAERHFGAVTESVPGRGEGWRGLAEALRMVGRMDEALEASERAALTEPEDAGLQEARGRILLALDRAAEAEASLREAIRIRPDFARAYVALGNALLVQGRDQEAEEALRGAVSLEEGNAEGWESLGEMRESQGEYVEAEQAYRQALAVDPGQDRTAWLLARLLLLRDRGEEACRELAGQRLAGAPLELRATCEAVRGNYEEAAILAARARGGTGEPSPDPGVMGFVMELLGEIEDARHWYETAVGKGCSLSAERLGRLGEGGR